MILQEQREKGERKREGEREREREGGRGEREGGERVLRLSICNNIIERGREKPVYCIYLGRFYVRSEVIHKLPPDYCVRKSGILYM